MHPESFEINIWVRHIPTSVRPLPEINIIWSAVLQKCDRSGHYYYLEILPSRLTAKIVELDITARGFWGEISKNHFSMFEFFHTNAVSAR